ncbi:MAG: hypothetical protein AAF224_03600 [Pseudomonadota bacterium]
MAFSSLPRIALTLLTSIGLLTAQASFARADGPPDWHKHNADARAQSTTAAPSAIQQKTRVINVADALNGRSDRVRTTTPRLGAIAAARTAAAPKASVSVEKGVRVTRGAPAQRFIDADLETTLSGAATAEPAQRVTKEKIVIYRECVKPRRLVTHGFFSGVRRYNRASGRFPVDTFGYNGYRRNAESVCGIRRI